MKRFHFLNRITLAAFLGLLLTHPVSLSAQTSVAQELENLLASSSVTYGQAALIILQASDNALTSSPEEAFRYAFSREWLPKSASASAPARLDGISLLIMNSFNMRGGMFYSLFKNAHFAYRELEYLYIIQGRTDPAMKVSGEELLFYVGEVLALQENQVARDRNQRILADKIRARLNASGLTDAKVRITGEGVTISLFDIQFLPDSSDLAYSEMAKLKPIADMLKDIPNRRLIVSGHTALAADEEGRLAVSRARAQTVANYLLAEGVRRQDEITVVGYGSTRPIGDNNTTEGMALNRRVEITILDN
jgi:outer membrane protein OmpA-like peptidoglycan-associated protein